MARLLPLLLGATLMTPAFSEIQFRNECGEVQGDFYQFSAKLLNGTETINFSDYQGKVVLVCNVATY
ncbi:hypothetical protein SK128_020147 [Halocaridina rubra]|uniref:Glutathione peroxidase n=1 Tax=Halocaridina rubra TaxID=373956 RepID=A0AAN9A5A9_HALRR